MLIELSVAERNLGFFGCDGVSAAKTKVIGEKSLHPYTFFALYLKAYVIPFVALTVADSASVSIDQP